MYIYIYIYIYIYTFKQCVSKRMRSVQEERMLCSSWKSLSKNVKQ